MILNIWILNIINQQPELTASAIDQDINIVCIQEHTFIHSEYIKYHDTGNGWTLVSAFSWKNSVNVTIGGVGMLKEQQVLKLLKSIEKIQPIMMVATFNGNPSATIIFCYSPTNVCEETDLIAYYNALSPLVRSIPKHNVLIIGRDINAQTGRKRKPQIQLTPHIKQKLGTSNWLHDRK